MSARFSPENRRRRLLDHLPYASRQFTCLWQFSVLTPKRQRREQGTVRLPGRRRVVPPPATAASRPPPARSTCGTSPPLTAFAPGGTTAAKGTTAITGEAHKIYPAGPSCQPDRLINTTIAPVVKKGATTVSTEGLHRQQVRHPDRQHHHHRRRDQRRRHHHRLHPAAGNDVQALINSAPSSRCTSRASIRSMESTSSCASGKSSSAPRKNIDDRRRFRDLSLDSSVIKDSDHRRRSPYFDMEQESDGGGVSRVVTLPGGCPVTVELTVREVRDWLVADPAPDPLRAYVEDFSLDDLALHERCGARSPGVPTRPANSRPGAGRPIAQPPFFRPRAALAQVTCALIAEAWPAPRPQRLSPRRARACQSLRLPLEHLPDGHEVAQNGH